MWVCVHASDQLPHFYVSVCLRTSLMAKDNSSSYVVHFRKMLFTVRQPWQLCWACRLLLRYTLCQVYRRCCLSVYISLSPLSVLPGSSSYKITKSEYWPGISQPICFTGLPPPKNFLRTYSIKMLDICFLSWDTHTFCCQIFLKLAIFLANFLLCTEFRYVSSNPYAHSAIYIASFLHKLGMLRPY